MASTQFIGTAAGQVSPVGQQVMPLLAEAVPPGQLALQDVKALLGAAVIVQLNTVFVSTAVRPQHCCQRASHDADKKNEEVIMVRASHISCSYTSPSL